MSTVITPKGGRRDCGCSDDCPPPGDCADGEECLPSDFIDPDDCPECPPGCDDGEECLPSNFIDPADCPAGCDVLDPSTIDALVSWYDADDAGTFTFTSGIEVDTWADKSASGDDMVTTNAFGGNPSRVAGAVNGRAAVFSGTTFAVDSGSMANTLTLVAPMHLVFVAQWNDPIVTAEVACGTGGDTWGMFRSGDGDLTAVANGGGHEQGFLASGVPHLISLYFDDGVNSSYRTDGVDVFAGDLGIAGQTAMQFFQNAGGGNALNGYMCEWLSFDRQLSDAELACVEAGLALRWLTDQTACEECSECGTADYVPYCLNSNADDVDTAFAATTPFGYWKLDDASGAPQDSSGNNNDGSVAVGTPTYAQAAITSKVGNSIALDGSTRLEFPLPSNLDLGATDITVAALIQFTGTGQNGDGNTVWRVFFGSGSLNGWTLAFFDAAAEGGGWNIDGVLQPLQRANTKVGSGGETLVDTAYPGDDPHFVVLRGLFNTMEVWWDGVMVMSADRNNAGGGTPNLAVGLDENTFWGSPALRVSNVGAWSRALTKPEIKTLTEAVMDAAAFGNAFAWQS